MQGEAKEEGVKKEELDLRRFVAGDREFLIPPPSDTKGHSTLMQFRCQPGWSRQVELAVASRNFPYKTVSDFMRHALARHVHFCEQQGEFPSIVAQLEMMDEVLRDEALNRKFDDMMRRLSDCVRYYSDRDEHSRAKELITDMWEKLEASPDSTSKRLYQRRMRGQFRHILPVKPLHPLRDIIDEEEEQEKQEEQ